MNVYMIIDDGDEALYWIADTMADATKASEDAHIARFKDDAGGLSVEGEAYARRLYRESFLESIVLIGELGNPPFGVPLS